MGYRSLCRLVTRANLARTKGVPRFTQVLLASTCRRARRPVGLPRERDRPPPTGGGPRVTAGAIGTDLYAVIVAMVVITAVVVPPLMGPLVRRAEPGPGRAGVANEEAPRGRGASHRCGGTARGLLALWRDLDRALGEAGPLGVLRDPFQRRLGKVRSERVTARSGLDDPRIERDLDGLVPGRRFSAPMPSGDGQIRALISFIIHAWWPGAQRGAGVEPCTGRSRPGCRGSRSSP